MPASQIRLERFTESQEDAFEITEAEEEKGKETVSNVLVTTEPITNVFCPTGKGGGIDPTCGSGGKSVGVGGSLEDYANKYRGKGVVTDAEPTSLTVYRVGGVEDRLGRGVFFGGDKDSIGSYVGLHEEFGSTEIKEYNIELKTPIVAKHQFEMHQHLFKGKTLQDAVYAEDKKSGFASSKEAFQKIEVRMAKKLSSMGYDSIVYTDPPAPAKTEVALIGRGIKQLQ